MASVPLIGRLFGRSVSEGAAFALGTATAPALTPAVRALINEAWRTYPVMPLRAQDAARAEVMQVADWLNLPGEAKASGIDGARFDALKDVFRSYPEVGELIELRRRDVITPAQLKTLLNRLGFSDDNAARLAVLEHVLLSAAELAMMRQQGFIQRDEQVARSAKVGVSAEEADLLFQISGLPPGIGEAQDAFNRGLIGLDEFGQIIREGHTKTKYTDLLAQLRHPILSAQVWAVLRIKGWASKAESDDGGALQGYTPEQMQWLYLAGGRPATVRQAMVGFRRGARVAGVQATEDAHVRRAVVESDIRPEWVEIEHAANETLPSAFVMRRLVGDGAVSEQEASDLLYESGWRRKLADQAAHAWATPTATGADPHIVRAETQLWATLHRSYLSHETDDATAHRGLTQLKIPTAAQATILGLWQAERSLTRRTLTPAQVKKAYSKGVLNPDTGTAWTQADAITYITDLGYDDADVKTYLAE